ncbi:GDSL esterase lipase At1g54790 [Olea europaea subsp. europaea]|uniref:GDSL esterase lipase At1g54790 n=1 Tax=Olea europaea subsp. europaea TaxID=158383 RepID=A0A8S0UAP3_OLEEU|nr:GDSL esterase lipase At1g54790 [Olea europaea subsp. europaea]
MASKTCTSFRILVLFLFLICLPLSNSIDFNYPAVFNFGDSNSDTGNLVAGMAEQLDPPNGQIYFQKPSGRFYDGHLIIDFSMDAMGLPFLNAYLEAIGTPSFRKGCNIAAAGSKILPATASSVQ